MTPVVYLLVYPQHSKSTGDTKMKSFSAIAIILILLALAGAVATAQGEVKSVQMKIDGYLCGN
jgi:hypothetical protein